MKLVILFYAFLYSYCLTNSFYKKCLSGIENINAISVSECRKYDPEGGYCCYVTYENPKKEADIFIYFPPLYYSTKKENQKKRSLQEPKQYCYGLSKEGYDNIDDVIDEISDEGGFTKLDIDCRKRWLKLNLINILVLLSIIIIL